jgi:hypothetical protein
MTPDAQPFPRNPSARSPLWVRIDKTQGEYKESAFPSIADMIADIAFRRSGPILLKKSVGAAEPIFSASLVRFYNNDAEDRVAEPRRDVGRSQ